MKKFFKITLIVVLVGFAALLTLSAINSSKLNDAAEKAGFDNVGEYKRAQKINIATKSEYDAHIKRQAELDRIAAENGGFLSVDEYKKAKAVSMPTNELYDEYLVQQAELKLAEKKRKAEEDEKARLAEAEEEKRKAEEAEKARLAQEQQKIERNNDGLVIGSIDVPALSNRLELLGVYAHSGVLECKEGAIEIDGSRLHMPTLKLLFEAKKNKTFYNDFIYSGGNSSFPSNLLELVIKSKDTQYAKKIAKQLLCEKIDLTSRTLERKPNMGTGSMVLGGLDLLLSKRISDEVPSTAGGCHFSYFFYPDNDVGLACDSYFVDTPNKLRNILSKDLKISPKNAEVLYKKVEEFVSLSEDELRDTYLGSCRSCIARGRLGEVELLIYQALTIFRTGRPLLCAAVGDGDNACSFSDYEAGLLGTEKQQSYELVDTELNKQWDLLKKQAATSEHWTSEHWKDVLDTQRAWVRMKVAFIKSGNGASSAHSENLATFLTKYRSGRLTYLRELFGDAQ